MMVSTLPEGPLGNLPVCAMDCYKAALNASWCPTTGMTCICTNEPLLTFEVGCFSKRCSLKENLFSTNLTRSACGIPEDNHANLTPALAGVLGMLALIMVILRLVQRVFLKKSFGWDDGMILMALICAVALNCMAFPLQKYGLGTNIWTIPFSNITRQLQYLYLSEVFYMPAEAFTQLSFLAFYQRILPRSKYQYVGYALGGITFIFGTSNTLVMILQCTPPSDFWRGWAGKVNGYCINTSAYSWYRAAMHIAMNLSIIAFPLWPLSKLSFSKRKKILVLLMLGTGVLITVISCLRLQSLSNFTRSANFTMDNNPTIYWGIIECDVSIMCACMPCILSLLNPLFPTGAEATEETTSNEIPTVPPLQLRGIKREQEVTVLDRTGI